jgi:hypothetical protein
MWVHRNQCCPEYKALSPLFERFSRVLHGYLSLQPGLRSVSRTRFRLIFKRKPWLEWNGLKSPDAAHPEYKEYEAKQYYSEERGPQ